MKKLLISVACILGLAICFIPTSIEAATTGVPIEAIPASILAPLAIVAPQIGTGGQTGSHCPCIGLDSGMDAAGGHDVVGCPLSVSVNPVKQSNGTCDKWEGECGQHETGCSWQVIINCNLPAGWSLEAGESTSLTTEPTIWDTIMPPQSGCMSFSEPYAVHPYLECGDNTFVWVTASPPAGSPALSISAKAMLICTDCQG